MEISDKHFHTCLSSYSFLISAPGRTKSYKDILQFEKFAVLAKTSETGSIEASALTPSCIHISFFSHLVSVSNCCKNHFYAGSKNVLTHIQKMKGINTGSWWKFFIFPAKNTLSLIRNAERHFYSPLKKTFLFFLLIKYLKIKKHSPIQVNALSKFSYFVVYDAYSETLAYLLKCNCLQLYFHVGMGT